MRTMKTDRTSRVFKPTERKALLADVIRGRRVDHRDGAGHLEPSYQASLYARVSERAQKPEERAFLGGPRSADPTAEEVGEEFVVTVTSGEDGGESMLDTPTTEENGGPFVETSGATEFAYGPDRSNPTWGTREPFPKS